MTVYKVNDSWGKVSWEDIFIDQVLGVRVRK